ncbi:transglutaminase-like cysteine peptidase [Ferrimonas marina]|uniref:Transglutaminase-like cysteine proteinase BTLCP n=1 Tax=Ferrimonas marina TaxID=299255 RepID=A0A1M5XVB5_9GAMM|nr:transglutaminase-like cysteine peptidase [Ferrimonas marina]SHI03652.1 transglutaminase-like cysteine proteinase BTLCP [Ferrimonas marina]
MRNAVRSLVAALLGVAMLCLAAPPEWLPQQQRKLVQIYGESAGLRYQAWRTLMSELNGQDQRQQLAEINRFFNQFRFLDDRVVWGEDNYWATPMEFIGAAMGDCEDFALAKFLSLRALGIPTSQLRLVYVKATSLNQFHMVVAYYPTPASEPLILDNLKGEILPASARRDLLPVYSFNGERLWLDGPGGGRELTNQPALDRWNRFNQRRQQGVMQRPLTARMDP